MTDTATIAAGPTLTARVRILRNLGPISEVEIIEGTGGWDAPGKRISVNNTCFTDRTAAELPAVVVPDAEPEPEPELELELEPAEIPLNTIPTPENHAALLAAAERARDAALEKRDRLQKIAEGRMREVCDDPAIVSGIRRKTTHGQAKRESAKFDRDMEAWKAYEAAERNYASAEGRVRCLRASAPVAFTEAQLKAAKAVRTHDGWYRLLKVNPKTVGVDAGFPWPHKIPRERVLEVR